MEDESIKLKSNEITQPELQDLRPDFESIDGADWSASVLAVLRASGIGPEHAPTILAALAESEGVSQEFETSGAQLGARIKPRLDAYATGKELKDLQRANQQVWRRHINALNAAQDKVGIYLVTYKRGYTTRDNVTVKARLQVDVDLFVSVVRTARHRADYEKSRCFAFEQAAVEVLKGKTKQRITRFKPIKMSTDELVARYEKTILNAAGQLFKVATDRGLDMQELTTLIFTKIEEVKAVNGYAPSLPADDCPTEEWQTNESPIEASPPTFLPIESCEEETGDEQFVESVNFLETFYKLGCEQFDFTIKDEVAGASTFEQHDFDSAIDRLPYFHAKNEQEQKSIIVRPRGNFLQLDDIKDVEFYRPFAFCIFETSPNNYQAWLAIKDEEHEEAKRRLVKTDAGASGATRLVGTWNKKPKYKPDWVSRTFGAVRAVPIQLTF